MGRGSSWSDRNLAELTVVMAELKAIVLYSNWVICMTCDIS